MTGNNPGVHSSEPVVLAWDAFVTGDRHAAETVSRQTLAVLDALTSLATPIEPDEAFLGELEHRLFGLGAVLPRSLPERASAGYADSRRTSSLPLRTDRFRTVWLLPVAALLAVILTGAAALFVTRDSRPSPREIPAATSLTGQPGAFATAPWGDQLLGVTIDVAAMDVAPPAKWDRGEFNLVTIPAGAQFTTDNAYFQCCSGVSVIHVQEGALEISPQEPIEVYRAGVPSPAMVAAGDSVTIEAGDAIVTAMEAHVEIVNESADQNVVVLHAMFYDYEYALGDGITPNGYDLATFTLDTQLESFTSEQVSITLEAVELAPGALLPITRVGTESVLGFYPDPYAMVRILEGTHDEVPPDDRGTIFVRTFSMRVYDPGDYTLFNASDSTATLYIVRLAPFGNTAVMESPPLQPKPHELLLDIQVEPADVGAQESGTWNRMEYAEVHVAPGERFTTDHPYFSCCAGIAAFQIREGSATFIVDGPIVVYEGAGNLPPVRIEPQTLVALEAGQTAAFDMQAAAVVTNTGPDELIMLGAYGYDFTDITGSNMVPPGYRDPNWVVDFTMDPLPGESVAFALESVTIEPGEFTHVLVDEDHRLVGFAVGTSIIRLAHGAVTSVPEDPLDSSIIRTMVYSTLAPGTYTLLNSGTERADIYFMRLAAGDSSSTGAPEATASPVAVNAPVVPSASQRESAIDREAHGVPASSL